MAYWFILTPPSPSGLCPRDAVSSGVISAMPIDVPLLISAPVQTDVHGDFVHWSRVPLDRLHGSHRMNSWGLREEMRNRSCSYHLFFLISDKLACAGFVLYLCGSGLTQAGLRSCFSGTVQQPWARESFDKTLQTHCESEICLFAPVRSVFGSQGDAPVGRLEWFSQWGFLSGNTLSSDDGLLVWRWDSRFELWVQ